MKSEITAIYGSKVRVRACGICIEDGKLLLVNHKLTDKGDFWAPPGGGVEFGHSIKETIEREFQEETGLSVECGQFLFGYEFIKSPLHAVELFFEVKMLSGKVKTGHDPELQVIQGVGFLSQQEINDINPENLHGIFRVCKKVDDLITLNGFYSI